MTKKPTLSGGPLQLSNIATFGISVGAEPSSAPTGPRPDSRHRGRDLPARPPPHRRTEQHLRLGVVLGGVDIVPAIVAFSFVLSVAATIAAAALPVWKASKRPIAETLRGG